ncbi:hypothetical protein FRC11_001249, partial [Ceratobasidium sp. 423]
MSSSKDFAPLEAPSQHTGLNDTPFLSPPTPLKKIQDVMKKIRDITCRVLMLQMFGYATQAELQRHGKLGEWKELRDVLVNKITNVTVVAGLVLG